MLCHSNVFPSVLLLIVKISTTSAAEPEATRWDRLNRALITYRRELNAVQGGHGGVRKLPCHFFSSGWGIGGSSSTTKAPCVMHVQGVRSAAG
jgi:hypothetical protein